MQPIQIKINPTAQNNQSGTPQKFMKINPIIQQKSPFINVGQQPVIRSNVQLPQQISVKPIIKQAVPSGPKIELSEDFKNDIQALVQIVNEGKDYSKLAAQIHLIAEQQLSVQLYYGGLNYCCVSGKNLGREDPFVLEQPGWEGISMIKEELVKCILKQMPVLDLSIYSIQIPTTKGMKELPIIDEVLVQIFGEERFGQLRLEALNKFHEEYNTLDEFYTFERNEIKYYAQSDGIHIQGQLLPIWEAKEYLQSQPELFSEDEARYLNQVLIQ